MEINGVEVCCRHCPVKAFGALGDAFRRVGEQMRRFATREVPYRRLCEGRFVPVKGEAALRVGLE